MTPKIRHHPSSQVTTGTESTHSQVCRLILPLGANIVPILRLPLAMGAKITPVLMFPSVMGALAMEEQITPILRFPAHDQLKSLQNRLLLKMKTQITQILRFMLAMGVLTCY
jgi:hypothetical protein